MDKVKYDYFLIHEIDLYFNSVDLTIPVIDVEAQTDHLQGITASKKDKIVLLNQLVTNCYTVIDSLNHVLYTERTENAKSYLKKSKSLRNRQ